MENVVLTGAAGFAGSHCLRHLLASTTAHVTCPVSLDHKGALTRIDAAMDGMDRGRLTIVPCDLARPLPTRTQELLGKPDVIINYAAQSHVERSISDPVEFVGNNVNLMLTVLEWARTLPGLTVLAHVSTDEIYGPCLGDAHAEWSPVVPSNPYAGSKACQEALAVSWWRTYGVPLLIINSMNMFGEHAQNDEKFVPRVMKAVAAGERVPVHCSASGRPGSRCWIHARNVADGILYLIEGGYGTRYAASEHYEPKPERFNIAGDELTNLEMARKIAAAMGRPLLWEMVDYHSSRPGHDLRYALDGSKMARTGWKPAVSLDEGIRRMVEHERSHLATGH